MAHRLRLLAILAALLPTAACSAEDPHDDAAHENSGGTAGAGGAVAFCAPVGTWTLSTVPGPGQDDAPRTLELQAGATEDELILTTPGWQTKPPLENVKCSGTTRTATVAFDPNTCTVTVKSTAEALQGQSWCETCSVRTIVTLDLAHAAATAPGKQTSDWGYCNWKAPEGELTATRVK